MHIDRSLYSTLRERLFRGKAIIILGPRQGGKTTLVRRLIHEYQGQAIYLNGDDIRVESLLSERRKRNHYGRIYANTYSGNILLRDLIPDPRLPEHCPQNFLPPAVGAEGFQAQGIPG